MSFFNIFNPKTTDKLIDNVSNGIDKAFFTDEEKSIASKAILDTKLKIATSNGNFQIAQRLLALLFSVNFILSFWMCTVLYFYSSDKKFKGFLSLISDFHIGWIMLAIITFYFGGGFIGSLQNINKK